MDPSSRLSGATGTPARARFFSLLALAAVSAADYLVGVEIGLSFFYLIPVSIATWGVGRAWGSGLSLVSGLLWLANDYLIGGHDYSHPAIPYWNAIVRTLFFLFASFTLDRLKAALLRERDLAEINARMVSTVSHELNNSLVSVQLAAELLEEQDGSRSEQFRARLYGILNQTHRNMAHTLKTLLNKARLESGRLRLEARGVEFRAIVKESMEYLSFLAREKGVTLTASFPERVIPVVCDPDIISLAVSNLVTNAIKYTPEGGRVEISLSESSGRIVFSVKDSGIGISQEDLEAVFSGFHRTEAGKKVSAGTGLGLNIARDFIEAHGGRLEVESAPGAGSRFFFSLPAAVRDQASAS